jgi:muramidase (phage lysozyme)
MSDSYSYFRTALGWPAIGEQSFFGRPDPGGSPAGGVNLTDNATQIAAGPPTSEQPLSELEAALQHPNVQAFLDVIGHTEGATYDSLYNDRIGRRRKFDDYSAFPGSGDHTPSGRYQIVEPTYAGLSRQLGVTDFSPHSQDLMAAQLLKEKGALAPLLNGDLDTALEGASKTWASLPQGPAQAGRTGQPYTSYDQVRRLYDLYRSSY